MRPWARMCWKCFGNPCKSRCSASWKPDAVAVPRHTPLCSLYLQRGANSGKRVFAFRAKRSVNFGTTSAQQRLGQLRIDGRTARRTVSAQICQQSGDSGAQQDTIALRVRPARANPPRQRINTPHRGRRLSISSFRRRAGARLRTRRQWRHGPVRECHNSRSSSSMPTRYQAVGESAAPGHQMQGIQSGSVPGVNRAAIRASCVRPQADSIEELMTAVSPNAWAVLFLFHALLSSDPVSVGLITTPRTPFFGFRGEIRFRAHFRPVQSRCRFHGQVSAGIIPRLCHGSSRKAIRAR